jgi:hypothetical protein
MTVQIGSAQTFTTSLLDATTGSILASFVETPTANLGLVAGSQYQYQIHRNITVPMVIQYHGYSVTVTWPTTTTYAYAATTRFESYSGPV